MLKVIVVLRIKRAALSASSSINSPTSIDSQHFWESVIALDILVAYPNTQKERNLESKDFFFFFLVCSSRQYSLLQGNTVHSSIESQVVLTAGKCSPCLCNREAEKNECQYSLWCSLDAFWPLVHRKLQPTFNMYLLLSESLLQTSQNIISMMILKLLTLTA